MNNDLTINVNRLKVFKRFTQDLATLSRRSDKKVAAIVTDKEMAQVLSIGINGGPKGLVDCMCKIDGKYGGIHAEINALVKCDSKARNKIMFVTLSPCKQCAAAIINAPGGFSTVYFVDKWKDDTGIKLLQSAGIHVKQI